VNGFKRRRKNLHQLQRVGNENCPLTERSRTITKMGLSQELAFQPVAKKSLPPKPKKNQPDMRLELRNLPRKPESDMNIWQMDSERALADSLDTPPMEQPDFNWPTSQQEESHFNEVPLQQQEFSWNNNQHMHDQLFHCSEDFIPEEELHQEHEQVQQMEEVQQVDQVQQPKEEVEEMRCIAPAEAEGIVQPKKESVVEEIYTFGVGDQNQLEFLNLEQKDTLKNVLEETGITEMDLSSFNMDTTIFDDSFVLSAAGEGTTETFVTGTATASATIADLLNVGDSAAQDDDPDWMPEVELLEATTSRSKQPAYARKSPIHSAKRTSMKKKPGRPEREGPYQIPTIPSRNARIGMSEEEIQGLKYRRMRELNNQASKACRAKRKNKQQSLEEELVVEQEKNLRLRQRLESMEKDYAHYKNLAASAKLF